jgi:hypothetical protein
VAERPVNQNAVLVVQHAKVGEGGRVVNRRDLEAEVYGGVMAAVVVTSKATLEPEMA